MIIYKVTNKVNGKVYIGQTTNTLEHRKGQHERSARCTYRPMDYNGNYPRYCSEECKSKYRKQSCRAGVEASANISRERGKAEQLRIKNCVLDWLKTKPQILREPIKYNSLTPICYILMQITNVGDIRTVMKPFNFTSKKEFIKYLLKIYAEQV